VNSLTLEDEISRHLANACSCVASARRFWDALDHTRREECYRFLTMAMEDLKTACAFVRRKQASPIGVLTDTLANLQADASLLLRLVDTSASFCRGMARRIGAADTCEERSGPALKAEG